MEQQDQDLDRALNSVSGALSTALSVVLVWPKATALASLAAIVLVVSLIFVPAPAAQKPPPTNAWRLEQMMQAVQEADARVRAEQAHLIEPGSDYRGIWDTLRDRDEPARTSPKSTEPAMPSNSTTEP